MIIYTPLDIPRIEPNNWDEWWEVWNSAAPVIKVKSNHNFFYETPLWKGFDLYRRIDAFKKYHSYQAPLAPQIPVVLDLVEQVKKHCVFDPLLIRVIENVVPVPPHSDYAYPNQYDFRTVLWNTHKTPIWTFTYENKTKDMILPDDTNSFYYLDNPVKHSAVYDPAYSKGLLQVYGIHKPTIPELLEKSISKYKDVAWIE